MSNARFILAAAIAIADVLASGVERFPGNARRVINPRFFRLGVAAGSSTLLDDSTAGLLQTSMNFMQFGLALDLDAKMIEARFATACRDCKIHPRIVQHPLGI